MYHDQGLIPVKLVDFDEAVNVTLGLPIVRTSPDHGTAYDIAGTGHRAPGLDAARARARGRDGRAPRVAPPAAQLTGFVQEFAPRNSRTLAPIGAAWRPEPWASSPFVRWGESEYAARGRSYDAGYAPRSSDPAPVVAAASRTPAEQARDAVSSLERTVQSLEHALATLRGAHAANNPTRWAEARDSLDRQLALATRAHERARAQLSDAPPGTTEMFTAATRALSDREQEARELVQAPTGFRPIASEAAIVATLIGAVDGAAQLGFARKEAALEAQFDALSPVESPRALAPLGEPPRR